MLKRFKHRFYSKRLFFGTIKLITNLDPDKYFDSGCNTVLNSRSLF